MSHILETMALFWRNGYLAGVDSGYSREEMIEIAKRIQNFNR